jgi:beta-lactamase superfamily II metal-dependent hydrolase
MSSIELENANKEISNLRNALEESRKSFSELKLDYDRLEKEKDFYFHKSRNLEQELEDKGENNDLMTNMFKGTYATAGGFDNTETVGGDGMKDEEQNLHTLTTNSRDSGGNEVIVTSASSKGGNDILDSYITTSMRTIAVIVVSGLSECDANVQFGLRMLRLPAEIFDSQPLCDSVMYSGAGVNEQIEVFVMIDPPQDRVKEVLSIPCRFMLIYFAGHTDIHGSWDLSFSDKDCDSNYLTIKDFEQCVGNKPGELHLNCCYSTKWTEKGGGAGALTQLNASDESFSYLSPKELADRSVTHVNSMRTYAINIDQLPVSPSANPLMKHLVCRDSSAMNMFQFYETAFRGPLAKNLPPLQLKDACGFYSFPANTSADCFLIVTGGWHHLLVDSSTSGGFAQAWDAVLGRIPIQLAICTHSDNDHIGGFDRMLQSDCLEVIKELWLNPSLSPIIPPRVLSPTPPAAPTRSKPQAQNLLQQYAQMKMEVPPLIVADDILPDTLKTSEFGEAYVEKTRGGAYPAPKKQYAAKANAAGALPPTVSVLWPNSEFFFKFYKNRGPDKINQMSIVVVVAYEGKHILLPGDVDCDLLIAAIDKSAFRDVKFDIVVIPHHGSGRSHRFGGDWPFRRIRTKRFIVTGNSTRHKHPHPDFLAQLKEMMKKQADLEVFFNHTEQANAFREETTASVKKRICSVNYLVNGHSFIKISLIE